MQYQYLNQIQQLCSPSDYQLFTNQTKIIIDQLHPLLPYEQLARAFKQVVMIRTQPAQPTQSGPIMQTAAGALLYNSANEYALTQLLHHFLTSLNHQSTIISIPQQGFCLTVVYEGNSYLMDPCMEPLSGNLMFYKYFMLNQQQMATCKKPKHQTITGLSGNANHYVSHYGLCVNSENDIQQVAAHLYNSYDTQVVCFAQDTMLVTQPLSAALIEYAYQKKLVYFITVGPPAQLGLFGLFQGRRVPSCITDLGGVAANIFKATTKWQMPCDHKFSIVVRLTKEEAGQENAVNKVTQTMNDSLQQQSRTLSDFKFKWFGNFLVCTTAIRQKDAQYVQAQEQQLDVKVIFTDFDKGLLSAKDNLRVHRSDFLGEGKIQIKPGFRYYSQQITNKQAYDLYLRGVLGLKKSIKIPHEFSLTKEEYTKIAKSVEFDYPEVWWVNETAYTVQNDVVIGVSITKLEREDIIETHSRLRTLVNRITQIKVPVMAPIQKLFYIQSFLSKTVEYKENLESKFAQDNIRTIIGALLIRKCVCAAIAKAYKFLCDLFDINCLYVSGFGNNEPHGWCIVQIGPLFYHVDPTWNLDDHHAASYLCVDDRVLFRTHTLGGRFTVPVCCSMAANYYQVRGQRITDNCDKQRMLMRAITKNVARMGEFSVMLDCLKSYMAVDIMEAQYLLMYETKTHYEAQIVDVLEEGVAKIRALKGDGRVITDTVPNQHQIEHGVTYIVKKSEKEFTETVTAKGLNVDFCARGVFVWFQAK